MSSAKTGHFLLKRQRGGRGYFGEVTVRLSCSGAETARVEWRVARDDTSSLQPERDPIFTDAALDGARIGLRLAEESSVETDGLVIEVIHVQLNFLDIEESAVRAAAALAVIDAFGLADRMRLSFSDGWVVHEAVADVDDERTP